MRTREVIDWNEDARLFEYTSAANPVATGRCPAIPVHVFGPPEVDAGSVYHHLDLSDRLAVPGPATSPALLASHVHLEPGVPHVSAPIATSELYYVMHGTGSTVVDDAVLEWRAGDVFVVPGASPSTLASGEEARLFRVTDEPLLRHLGVRPCEPRFRPTRFDGQWVRDELDSVASRSDAASRNRTSVLLATAPQTSTLTVTHVLWAMLGVVGAGSRQAAHRHQSVALDLVVECEPGCATLLGRTIDEHGQINDPMRVEWEPGSVFVTPPGWWHAHVNDSGRPAFVFPVQDAGLHTYLRTLDIRFARR